MNTLPTPGADRSAPKELLGIQHLRGIAALLVVLTHIDAMSRFPKYFGFDVFDGWFGVGAVGVQLFFVISGFIIPYVSVNRESLEPKTTARSFFQRRFVRIIPFMWICIIGYAALRFVGRGSFSVMPYLRAFTLFPVGEVSPDQIWTLRHEFLFYTIFATAVLVPKTRQWFLIGFWFLSPFVWFTLTSNGNNPRTDSFFFGLGNFLFNKHNIFFGVGFLIGILHMKNHIKWRWETRHGFLLCLMSSIPLLVGALFFGTDTNFSSFFAVLGLAALAAISLLVGLVVDSRTPLTLIDRLGLLLGDASYSIYLTHAAFISALLGIWSKILPNAHYALVMFGGTIIACSAGILVHLFVEKPIIRITQRMFKSKQIKHSNVKVDSGI